MSTPKASGAASMTRLPPSPEATFILPGAPPDHLSLDADKHNRLRSIARYATFCPQAIACSTPLQTDKREPRYVSSVAAVAGPNGIALFRVSRPQTPVVVLSHASSKKSLAGTVSSLSFQPQSNDSPLLLAAARGCGVLVWDVSGHSLSPLIGRLAMEPTLSSSDRITSISWKTSSAQSLLATTNGMKACLWDIRTALRANLSRPSLQLGTSRKLNSNGVVVDPLVKIAASNRDQVATLDASGTVQVFDIRMTDCSSNGSIGEVSSFSACHHVGVGLEFLPTHKEETCWVTWGLDAPQSDAIVKVWSDCVESDQPMVDADKYWLVDGSPSSCPTKSIDRRYQQVAEFWTPYLACARVSPEPFENQIVTVGMVPGKGEKEANGWQAEVWVRNDSVKNYQTIGTHYGAEKITSFRVLHDDRLTSMIGTNATLGSLRGAELALETGSCEITGDRKDGVDLLLCCLSDNGYVTTQVSLMIPGDKTCAFKLTSQMFVHRAPFYIGRRYVKRPLVILGVSQTTKGRRDRRNLNPKDQLSTLIRPECTLRTARANLYVTRRQCCMLLAILNRQVESIQMEACSNCRRMQICSILRLETMTHSMNRSTMELRLNLIWTYSLRMVKLRQG